jgi:hypothetical protein
VEAELGGGLREEYEGEGCQPFPWPDMAAL